MVIDMGMCRRMGVARREAGWAHQVGGTHSEGVEYVEEAVEVPLGLYEEDSVSVAALDVHRTVSGWDEVAEGCFGAFDRSAG